MTEEPERHRRLQQIDDELERLRKDETQILERISMLRAERAALVDQRRRDLAGIDLATAALEDEQLVDRLTNETRAMGERFLQVRRWTVDDQGTVRGWAPVVALDCDTDLDRTATEIHAWIRTYTAEEPDVPANWRNRGHALVLVRRDAETPLIPLWVRRAVDEAFSVDTDSQLHTRHQHEGTLTEVLTALVQA